MPGRIHSADSTIDQNITTLKVLGDRTYIPGSKRSQTTAYIKGDTNIDGILSIQGDLVVNGGAIAVLPGTNTINGYVLTVLDSGAVAWKTKYWKDNDNPQLPSGPSDNNIYTTHNIGIGITNPDEKLHISTTDTGGGAEIGSAFIGNDNSVFTDLLISNSNLKGSTTGYLLKQTNSGESSLNSTTNINFKINNNLVSRFDSSGNLGIGVTTPTELLHVGGNTIIEGDLNVNGTLTAINSSVVEVEDANLHLAKNNPSDSLDIGFFGQYVDGGVTKFTGLFRDASSTNKTYELFQQLEEKPTTTINKSGTGYERASLNLKSMDIQDGITFSQSNSKIIHNNLIINGTEPQVFFNSNGNIGVGVTSATEKIDVDGNINISGQYKIDGNAVLSENTLGSGVTSSNLQTVGILNSLSVTGLSIFNNQVDINDTTNIYGQLNVLGGISFGGPIDPKITSNLLKLASSNTGDLIDIGFYGLYNDGTSKFAGLYRDATDDKFKLFTGITIEPNNTVTLDDNYSDLIVKELDTNGRINITNSDYRINTNSVLSENTLGNGVTSSNLQVVGDLDSLNVVGDLTVDTNTLYVDSANNKVGIGTLTPVYQLDITGLSSIGANSLNANGGDLILKQFSTNNILFQDSSSSTLMTLDNSGNLGIGLSPTEQLSVANNASIGGNMTIGGDLTVNGTLTSINSSTVTINDNMIKLADGNSVDTVDTGVYSLYNDGTSKFSGYFRDASDSGIIKFYQGLEVEPALTIDTGATGFELASLQSKDITLNEIKYTSGSNNLTFTNSGSIRSILTPTGFFGVGVTAEYPLHVSKLNLGNWSTKIVNSATEVFIANSNGNGMSINSGVDNTNTSLNLNVRNTTTNNVFVVRNDDKVGVLTSTPSKTFHVNIGTTGDGAKIGNSFIGNWANNSSNAVFSHDDLSQTANSYAIKQTSSGQTDINASTGQIINMNINNSTKLTVNDTGLGIGVVPTTQALEINGELSTTGFTTNNSTITGTGDTTLTHDTSSDNNINFVSSGTNISGITNVNLQIQGTNEMIIQSNGVTIINDLFVDTDTLYVDTTNDKVGINTNSPDTELDVIGSQYISSKLGVGITNPVDNFHVVGDGTVTGDFTIGGNLIFDGIAVENVKIQDPLIKLASNNSGDLVDSGLYSLYIDTGTTKFNGMFRDATDSKFKFFNGLEVEPTTSVDTGATGYTSATVVVDTLEADTEVIAPEFTSTCDERVKTDILNMNDKECFDKINKLDLFSYKYINEYNNSNDRVYGLIAQNVEKIIPEAIKTKKVKVGNKIIDDFKVISNNTIIANLIGAIKYQKNLIDKLTEKINNL